MSTCSCDNETAHIVARRETADGHALCLWTDGALTWGALGRIVVGCARTPVASDLAAGWLTVGEACLYEAREIPALIRAARRVAARGGLPGDLRAAMAPRGMRAIWITIQTDRDGKAVVACWKLPRIIASGLAVWRDRGRYCVMREIGRTGTYEAAGAWLPSMSAVRAELTALGIRGVA